MPSTAEKIEPRVAIGLFALKQNEEFLVADALGDINGDSDGFFRRDTRVLSRFRLSIGANAPSLLSSGVSADNVFFRANVTNRPLPELGGHVTPQGVIHIERARLLWDCRLHERLTLTNYGSQKVGVPLRFEFAADFADIFEVRGHDRARRGRVRPAQFDPYGVAIGYEGLDGVLRHCIVAFSERPDRLTDGSAEFALELPAHGRLALYVEVGPDRQAAPDRQRFRTAAARARAAMRCKRRSGASVRCPSRPFRTWLEKSRSDLALLTTELPTGRYPYAGIPWFSAPFGRDGIITALQVLWLDPLLARGVLTFLAEHQANDTVPFQDATPGKIMHETRNGEMAARNEVPFARYYGGVDTTPLFVMLAGAYAARTNDVRFIDRLWPALERAMAWIDGYGDSNRDGFVDYAAARATGLVNQGWKDSGDSVFHADGRAAESPIALVEVQGYVYAARNAMALLADQRGDTDGAERLHHQADALRGAVESAFWLPDLNFYALALDGRGKPCRVRTSNAGQLLYTRLPAPPRATYVAEQLMSASFNDGWGIRTLAQGEARFNPMSYHNGSVWPHDTAMCAAGIAHYGNRRAAAELLSQLFAAALHFDTRLPELYCGFRRRPGEPPVGYPVACLPQAWSSGAVFMLLQACLGIDIDAVKRAVRIDRPELPSEIDRLAIHDLVIQDARISLLFERVAGRVTATPLGATDSIEVLIRA
ncbi:MAG TPA: amylo-alpha-1,6-glucosidase [Casimicrobiaceae bacterium]|jgi:glycogen debranching enzyme